MAKVLAGSPREEVWRGAKNEVNRAAADALGVTNLRGLIQAPTERGVLIYAPGADDENGGAVVEIEY